MGRCCLQRGSLGRGPGPWRAVQPKGQHWGGEGRKMLRDCQGGGFGFVPIAFLLWEEHPSVTILFLPGTAPSEPWSCSQPGCGCV